jgi:hypothetical protein
MQYLREIAAGWRDFARLPEDRDRWGGPFNGQAARMELVEELLRRFHPLAIVETGAFHATTTEHLAETGVPVYTIEANPRNFGFSLRRLIGKRNVSMRLGDSREVLKALFDGALSRRVTSNLLFYLDAHWHEDLPLRQEIDIIFSHCPAAIVLIDDFQVPDDPCYCFDDYGGGKALTAHYVSSQVSKHALGIFYPSTPSSIETGAKRGCAVLAKMSVHGKALSTLPLLRVVETYGLAGA